MRQEPFFPEVKRLKFTIECFHKTFLTTSVAMFLGTQKQDSRHSAQVFS